MKWEFGRRRFGYLIFELLAQLQADGEEHQNLVQPRYRALGVRRLVLHLAVAVDQLVDGEDQLVALDVEADGQILRQIGRQRLLQLRLRKQWHPNYPKTHHVAALDQVVHGLLAGHYQAGAPALQAPQNVAQNVQDFVRRPAKIPQTGRRHRGQHLLELVVLPHVVDVVDGLLQVIGCVLHLLQLPRILVVNGGAHHGCRILPAHLEVDVLQQNAEQFRNPPHRVPSYRMSDAIAG